MGLGIDSITFDCRRPAPLARFWAEALGYEVRAYDDEEMARLGAAGISDVEDDPSVAVDPPDPQLPTLFFVRVPEGKVVKNRVHLDLEPTTSMEEEVGRLVALGATVSRYHEVDDGGWTVMLDLEGNEFCVVEPEPDAA